MSLIGGGNGGSGGGGEVMHITTSQQIIHNSVYAVDTVGGIVTLTPSIGAGLSSFTVFDASQNFSANSCIVDFGGTQGTATLQTKNDNYLFYWDGAQWRYLDQNTKNGGIV